MSVRFLACFAIVASMLIAGVSSAQDQKKGEFSVQRFSPAAGPRNFITVQGARTDGKMAFSVSAFGNYGDRPFVITTCVSATDCAANNASQRREINIVETLVTGELVGSFTVIPALQLGLHLPYTFTHGAGITTDPNDVEPWKTLLVENDPGFAVGESPVLIIHGEHDEQIPVISSQLLLARMCGIDQVVERRTYPGQSHAGVIGPSFPDMLEWIDARLAGEEAPTSCT